MSLNKKMGDLHESFLLGLFGGRQSRGSGNQWHNPLDGRMSRLSAFAFGWDGKSTLGKSVGVSRAMWAKAREQTGGEVRPMLGLRFYDNESLDVGLDLVVVSAADAAELVENANNLADIREQGCLQGLHRFDGSICEVCGIDSYTFYGTVCECGNCG